MKTCPYCKISTTIYDLSTGLWICPSCSQKFQDDTTDICKECSKEYVVTGGSNLISCLHCGSQNVLHIGPPRIGIELPVPQVSRRPKEIRPGSKEDILRLIKASDRSGLQCLGYPDSSIDRWFQKVASSRVAVRV